MNEEILKNRNNFEQVLNSSLIQSHCLMWSSSALDQCVPLQSCLPSFIHHCHNLFCWCFFSLFVFRCCSSSGSSFRFTHNNFGGFKPSVVDTTKMETTRAVFFFACTFDDWFALFELKIKRNKCETVQMKCVHNEDVFGMEMKILIFPC